MGGVGGGVWVFVWVVRGVVEFLVQLSGGWFVSLTLCYLSTSVSSKGEKSQHIFEILTSITKKRDGLPNYT